MTCFNIWISCLHTLSMFDTVVHVLKDWYVFKRADVIVPIHRCFVLALLFKNRTSHKKNLIMVGTYASLLCIRIVCVRGMGHWNSRYTRMAVVSSCCAAVTFWLQLEILSVYYWFVHSCWHISIALAAFFAVRMPQPYGVNVCTAPMDDVENGDLELLPLQHIQPLQSFSVPTTPHEGSPVPIARHRRVTSDTTWIKNL